MQLRIYKDIVFLKKVMASIIITSMSIYSNKSFTSIAHLRSNLLHPYTLYGDWFLFSRINYLTKFRKQRELNVIVFLLNSFFPHTKQKSILRLFFFLIIFKRSQMRCLIYAFNRYYIGIINVMPNLRQSTWQDKPSISLKRTCIILVICSLIE